MSKHSTFKRLKRAIMMATVFWVFDKDNRKQAAALDRCNLELNLVRNLDALKIPYRLKDLIWADPKVVADAKAALDRGDIDHAVQILRKNTPRILKYGKSMQTDIADALLAANRTNV